MALIHAIEHYTLLVEGCTSPPSLGGYYADDLSRILYLPSRVASTPNIRRCPLVFCLHAVRRLLAECFKSPRNRPSRTKKNTRHRSVRLKLEPLENRVLLTAVAPFVDPHPSPFDEFGATVLALGNANVVVTAPFDNAGGTEAGAVYLFNQGGTLISTLRGSHPYDMVGSGGLTALSDGAFDYVIKSQYWNGGEGAVTLGDGGAGNGVSGVVSPANSLVGNIAGDYVGSGGVLPLANGNYVVESPDWSSAKAADVGAVTFVSGAAETGQVLAENSLVGSTSGDYVGSGGVVALSPSNNFVVDSPDWTNPDGSNGSAVNAGAVTWVNGTTGTNGGRRVRRQRHREQRQQPRRHHNRLLCRLRWSDSSESKSKRQQLCGR